MRYIIIHHYVDYRFQTDIEWLCVRSAFKFAALTFYHAALTYVISKHEMSPVMRKPIYAICKQQKTRSACTSAQFDKRLFVRCLDSIIPLVSISRISSLYLASVAVQAGWVYPGRKPRRQVFLVTRLKWENMDTLSENKKKKKIFSHNFVNISGCHQHPIRRIRDLYFILEAHFTFLRMPLWSILYMAKKTTRVRYLIILMSTFDLLNL